MPSLYKVEQGMYKNLDNALRNINRKLVNAAKAFGTGSELYQHYQREVTAMFGAKQTRIDPKTGAIQVIRKTKDIVNAGVSMQRVQHALDYMSKHSVKDEKKRIKQHIKEKRKAAYQSAKNELDLAQKAAAAVSEDDSALQGDIEAANAMLQDALDNAKAAADAVKHITSDDIKKEAQHLADSEATFEDILDYIYAHIDPKTHTGEAEALEAYDILTREGDRRTYGELRAAAALSMQLRDRLKEEKVPDYVPKRLQNLNDSEELY